MNRMPPAGLNIESASYDTKTDSVLIVVNQDRHHRWERNSGCTLQGVALNVATNRNVCFSAKMPFCLCL